MAAAEKKQNKLFLEGSKNSKTDKDWWDNISESQRQNINEGIKGVEEGRTVLSAEFWNRLKNS